MKRKIVLSIVMLAILAAAITAVVVVNNKSGANDIVESYSNIDELNEASDIKIEYSDRLCGMPATDFEANSSMVEIRYSDAGYIRKTLGVVDNSGGDEFSEVTEKNIGGRNVVFKGEDGKVFLAIWNENNFAYTISVSEGIDAEEMSEYINATI